MIGTTEAIIIGGIVMLLFGAKKLPELAKSMGQSKAAFDEGLKESMSSEEDKDEKDKKQPKKDLMSIIDTAATPSKQQQAKKGYN